MKRFTQISLFTTALAFATLAWSQAENVTSFLKQAAETNVAETEMADVAQSRTRSDHVKEYAKHLEEAHKRANDKLESIAEKKDVDLPDDVSKKHEQQKQRLSKLDGQAFDREYLKAMVDGHKEAIKLYEKQAQSSQDQEVKQYAEQTLPELRAHLEQAQKLQQSTGRSQQGQPKSK